MSFRQVVIVIEVPNQTNLQVTYSKNSLKAAFNQNFSCCLFKVFLLKILILHHNVLLHRNAKESLLGHVSYNFKCHLEALLTIHISDYFEHPSKMVVYSQVILIIFLALSATSAKDKTPSYEGIGNKIFTRLRVISRILRYQKAPLSTIVEY